MQKLKKISLFMTLAIFLSSFNLLQVKAIENLDKRIDNQSSITEVTPVILQDPSELTTNGAYIPTAIKVKKSSYPLGLGILKASALPEKYDLRTYGHVTAVRNQGSIGSCWTFSSYGSLESTVKKASGKAYDFSEIHMAVYNGEVGPNDGGNNLIASSYLVAGKGPILESDAPYPNPPIEEYIDVREDLKTQYRVKDIIFLPQREHALDNDDIKNAIITYGAVSSSYYDNSYYYNYFGQTSYYNKYTEFPNHAITIVGWDDTYSKDNFGVKPPGNGAFIVKNSWGDKWGDNGYFYISYYDVCLGYDSNAVFYGIEDINTYKNIYRQTEKAPYGYYPMQSIITAAGNRFTAKDNENISAVGFYTFSENISYEVWIDKIVGGNITKATTKVASGVLPYAGYHTIKIQTPVKVNKGEEFMVWLKLSGDGYYGEGNESVANGKSYIQYSYGSILTSEIAFTINAYSEGVDFSKYLLVSSVTPENNEVTPNESITITFNDNISAGSDYSKISLKDENGVEVKKSVSIKGKNLIIKETPENHVFGKLKLFIPKTAVINSKGQAMYNDYIQEFNVYPSADTVVSFKDKALENAIRSRINKYSGNITAGDMRKIDELRLYGEGISNLSGLEYAVNLYSLDLNNNEIISIKPLSKLLNLKDLDLGSNNIKDISPLSNLEKLTDLNLSSNSIRDISIISKLTSLDVLDLSYNLIDNIGTLEDLPKIYYINFSHNLVSDIRPLKKIIENRLNSYISITLFYNYIDFSSDTTAISILNYSNNSSIFFMGEEFQYSSLKVGALNNKSIGDYYQHEYMIGESIVLEYNQPISLTSNAKSLISLSVNGKLIDFKLRVAENTLIITPVNTNYKGTDFFLSIGKGAVRSISNPTVTNHEESFVRNLTDKLYGDVDSNGIVDLRDFSAIAASYNCFMDTDSGWSFSKDLNRDGIIDVYDLCIAPTVRY